MMRLFVLSVCVVLALFCIGSAARVRVPAPNVARSPHKLETYSEDTALFALYASKATYCSPDLVLNWSCGESCDAIRGFEVFSVYDNDSWDSMAMVGVHHTTHRIVVAFRGTRSVTNWLSNLSFWPMEYPNLDCRGNCSVHRGFYHTYQSFIPGLLLDVAMLQVFYPKYTCFITGHSLGGALAVFAALDMSTLWGRFSLLPEYETVPPPLELYTFGEPRVGNGNFSVWASRTLRGARQLRLTHGRDPVPHVPPMSWGYVHVPQEHWFWNDTTPMDFTQCNDTAKAEDTECSLSVWATSISDHLAYLGICTRCTCTAADLEAIESLTLPPIIHAAITDEYSQHSPYSA